MTVRVDKSSYLVLGGNGSMNLLMVARQVMLGLFLLVVATAVAQAPAPNAGQAAAPARVGPMGPTVVSPEVMPDRRVTLRIYAPGAQAVTTLLGEPGPTNLVKGSDGVWETTLGPLAPGAYRYNFNVDGATVVDSRNIDTERMQVVVRSILYVPGVAFMDERKVPHGAISEVFYYSTVLGKFRSMHVYTPPGYEDGTKQYPVLYLLHGANESDDSWHSVGRAGFILDNLIADGKAVPMIVVMPNGHTDQTPPSFGGPRQPGDSPRPQYVDKFLGEFDTDIMPYAESHYRIFADRSHRAIAGLSMGGSQTLSIAFAHLDRFSAIGVFSSGVLFGGVDEFEKNHLAALDDANLKKGLKIVWFSTGADDSLLPVSKATVAMLNRHGINATFKESAGAHTWINWRNYFYEFAPQLFR